MNMNFDTIKKTYESYVEAMRRLCDRGFTRLSRSGSGYTHYLGEEFSCYVGNKSDADNVSIQIAELMEYGRPKVIEKSYWVYRSDFISFTFYSNEPYTTYHIGYDHDDVYDLNKEVVKEDSHIISVRHSEFGIGLGYWNEEKKNELRKIAASCKPKVSEKILTAIDRADKRIYEWQEARKKLTEDIVGTA